MQARTQPTAEQYRTYTNVHFHATEQEYKKALAILAAVKDKPYTECYEQRHAAEFVRDCYECKPGSLKIHIDWLNIVNEYNAPAPRIINKGWTHFEKVYSMFTLKGYKLNYSRPADAIDPHPWESCINPSFTHGEFWGNSFQLIWNRADPRQVFLNHGNPDVYNHIREALTEAGFTLTDTNPNR